MKHKDVLRSLWMTIGVLLWYVQAQAQILTAITKPGIEVGTQLRVFDGKLYFSTLEGKDYKIWAYNLETKHKKLVMKSQENIGHFFVIDKKLVFTLDRNHVGEDGRIFYLDEHGRPLEVIMPQEAGPQINPGHGRYLEIYAYRKGFLILAPVLDGKNKFKLYKYALKQDSARRFMPEKYFVRPGLLTSPDNKIILAAVEIEPPHPWENNRAFWNKFSQVFIIHSSDGEPFEKWMDHAELVDVGYKYTKRTWMNLNYKELKDKGEDVMHHSVFVFTNPSEKKGTMPHHVGEAVDSSMFLFQNKICYYMRHKTSIYLVSAFEYPDKYQLKYAKLGGHDMQDFAQVQGQFCFDEVLNVITKHKGTPDYYSAWTLKYKFDTAEWLEAHTFMQGLNYDARLSATMPKVSPFKAYTDTLGNPVYLSDGANIVNNRLYSITKNGATPVPTGPHGLSNISFIAKSWKGVFVLKQKPPMKDTEQLVLKCKDSSGIICNPGDKYEQGYDFECNHILFFSVLSAQTKRRFNWQSDGTLPGTKRMDLGDLSLQLDFSRPVVGEKCFFVPGRINDKQEKDQLFVIEL